MRPSSLRQSTGIHAELGGSLSEDTCRGRHGEEAWGSRDPRGTGFPLPSCSAVGGLTLALDPRPVALDA